MNAELRARAIEAAARARYTQDTHTAWADALVQDNYRARAALEVDAVLAVVADWCDKRREAIPPAPSIADSIIEIRVGATRAGCRSAFAEVAGACRSLASDVAGRVGRLHESAASVDASGCNSEVRAMVGQ